MEFSEATERLMGLGVSLEEIGDALGIAYTTVRATRLDPDSANYRRPPEDWRPKLAALARERGEELKGLAEELETKEAS